MSSVRQANKPIKMTGNCNKRAHPSFEHMHSGSLQCAACQEGHTQALCPQNSVSCAEEQKKKSSMSSRRSSRRRSNHKEHEIGAKLPGYGLKCVRRTTGPCHKQIYCEWVCEMDSKSIILMALLGFRMGNGSRELFLVIKTNINIYYRRKNRL